MRLAGRALAAAALAAVALAARAGIAITDDLGRRVALESPARRVATLAPSITEAAFAVGAGSRVVAASAWSDYPPAAAALPVVSTAFSIDFEALARLSPDLVIAWKDSFRPADIPRLEALGAKVAVLGSRGLADIPHVLSATAALLGADAGPSVRAYRSKLASLRERYAGKPRVRVFLEISRRPLMTVGRGQFMGEALQACGARNVFDDLAEAAPQVSWEELFARDPDAIVGTGPEEGGGDFLREWREHRGLAAVRQGRLAWVPSRALGRPSPRVVEGVEALCLAVDRMRAAAR